MVVPTGAPHSGQVCSLPVSGNPHSLHAFAMAKRVVTLGGSAGVGCLQCCLLGIYEKGEPLSTSSSLTASPQGPKSR